jgi:hypothetical protein
MDEGSGEEVRDPPLWHTGETNNTTHFVHLQLLSSWGFRHHLAIVSPYNPLTRGPVRVHPRPYEFTTDLQSGLHAHFITRLCLEVTLSHTHTAQYFHPTP